MLRAFPSEQVKSVWLVAPEYSCMNCGNELPRGSNFCDKCGSSTARSLWTTIQRLQDRVKDLEKPRLSKRKRTRIRRKRLEKIPEDKLLELHKKGLNDREIAKELNVAPSSVYRMRRKLSLPANAPRGFPEYVREKKKPSEEKTE